MKIEDLEHNAQRLWFNASNTSIARGDRYQELFGAYYCPLLAKIIFWIRDVISRGDETKKVHELALNTLLEMAVQLKKSEPRFVFNGDDRFGQYPGCPVLGVSYHAFAGIMITEFNKSKLDDFCKVAVEVQTLFDSLPLFAKYPPLTKESIVNRATGFDRPLVGPTFSDEELKKMQAEKGG